MDKFTPWLLKELETRSWRPADLARRAGLHTGSLSSIKSGNRRVGPDMCKAIAQALGEPPEKLFRLADLLPPFYPPNPLLYPLTAPQTYPEHILSLSKGLSNGSVNSPFLTHHSSFITHHFLVPNPQLC